MDIYLDHNATAPPRPEVIEAALPFITRLWANPASPHQAAREPAAAVEEARRAVAAWSGARPRDVTFTSGATESNHAAILGSVRPARPRWLVSAVEHPSALAAARGRGAEVLPVDSAGRLILSALEEALGPDVAGVTLMAANNETGVLQPIEEAHDLCEAAGAWLHVDGAQVAGRVGLPTRWDLLTVSGHKAGGLKGGGALVVRPHVRWEPLLGGGAQERGRRGGTVDVPAVVALGVALSLPVVEVSAHRDRLEVAALELGMEITASSVARLPNTSHLRLPGVQGESVVQALDLLGVRGSTGSACASGASEPSHVLEAMGLPPDSGIRLSCGWSTTAADIDRAIEALQVVVPRCRKVLGPVP